MRISNPDMGRRAQDRYPWVKLGRSIIKLTRDTYCNLLPALQRQAPDTIDVLLGAAVAD